MQLICSLFNREVATLSTRLDPQGNTTTATPVSAAKPKFRKDFHKHHFLAQHAQRHSWQTFAQSACICFCQHTDCLPAVTLHNIPQTEHCKFPYNWAEHLWTLGVSMQSSTPTEKREKPHNPDRWIATLRPKFPKHTSRLQCPHGCQDPEVLWKVLNQNLWPRINT